MKMTAQRENTRTLAAALGIVEDEAETLLCSSILITFDANEEAGCLFAAELKHLLQRTVNRVSYDTNNAMMPDVEVIIGKAAPLSDSKHLFVNIREESVVISETELTGSASDIRHPVLLLIGACYAAAKTLACYLGERFPYRVDEPLVLDYRAMFSEEMDMLHNSVDIGTVYLAGAGAVGNGFIYGLRYFDILGVIHVTDPKTVKDGNLNRCMHFDHKDLGLPKAEQLCKNAQPFFKNARLVPRNSDLRDLEEKCSGPWLPRLVVTVDSRMARRSLQTEIPGEVYDASTTGIQEVVLHFNEQPTDGKACLSCIYVQEEGELAHGHHVAEVLGVAIEKVLENIVDQDAANAISTKYPEIGPETIIGMAYDSLFKQMCGQGKLQSAADKQVLAPFAFVSVLAGTMLAIEMVRRIRKGNISEPFNYWRLSPYSAPVIRGRRIRGMRVGCEFCSDSNLQRVANKIWSSDFAQLCPPPDPSYEVAGVSETA